MKDIINHFGKERLGEIIRFGIVGVLAVAIQYGVYLLLLWLFADQAMTPYQSNYRGGFGGEYFPLLANCFAYVVSFLFNYVASTRYTFHVRSTARRGAGFTLAHLVNFLLQTLLLALFLRLGLSKPVAMLPVFALCVPINFLLVRYFLKKGEEGKERAEKGRKGNKRGERGIKGTIVLPLSLKTLHYSRPLSRGSKSPLFSPFNPFYTLKNPSQLSTMNSQLFSLRRHERPVFLFALLLAIVLQAIIICRYNDIFTNPGPKYWAVFLHNFSVSGYDPITYSVVTDWTAKYNVYRHPLLAFFMAPLYWLNLGLTALTGVNCVQYVVAFFWILATAYAFLFFYRIVLAILTGSDGSRFKVQSATRVQGSEGSSDGSNTFSTAPQALSQPLRNSTLNCATGALLTAPQAQALLLSALLFSFGHVLLAGMAPDHFILSMMMLLLLLLVSLEKLQQQRPFTIAEALVFFIIIAGITLSNGVKVFICVLLVNWLILSPKRKKISSNDVETQTARVSTPLLNGRGKGVGLVFLSLLFASALLWGIARAEYHYLVLPQEKIAHAKKAADKKRKQEAAARRKAEAEKTFQMLIDQAQATGDTSLFAQATHRLDSVRTAKPKVRRNPYGKPIAKGEFMRWTDITTSRWSSAVENLFGEGIQLHRDYALGDVLRHRPVIVNYRSPVQYIIEAFILLLFLAGVWCGRRSRFLWIALTCAAFDMLLHLGLGFGLNEVYIMSAHWIFVLPLAMTFLFKNLAPSLRGRGGVGLLLLLLTLYLYIWNFVIIFQEMT